MMLTEAFISALREARVFLRPGFGYGDASGKKIPVSNRVTAEPYAMIPEFSLSWDAPVSIGAFSYVVPGAYLAGCDIGRFSSIASGVRVMGESHPMDRVSTSTWSYGDKMAQVVAADFGVAIKQDRHLRHSQRTSIGDDVWIGEHATLKRGVILGTGCVVAAHAVVAKNVPPYAIVAGNPAKLIRHRFDADIQAKLLASQWWKASPAEIARLDMTDVAGFLNDIPAAPEYDYAVHDVLQLARDHCLEGG